MAQPFFNSNYGSSLMRVDNSGIQQAGQAYGQMFANLGKTIGSTIEKFREGKEKKEQQQRSEDLFLRQYESNPDNPIFSNLGIESIEEAKAVAKDISKDPKLVSDAMKFGQMAMDQQKAQQANELFNRTIAADDRKIADRQREENFNRFLGQPGKPMVDPSGPDRNSVLRNLQAGKGATPPARMIPGPSPAEDMLISQEAKNFMRQVVGAGQPVSEALPMAQKLDSQIAVQTPKPYSPTELKALRELEKPSLTVGEETIDREFAKSIIEFNPADIEKGLTQLREASDRLGGTAKDKDGNAIEPENLTGVMVGIMPDSFNDIINPQASEVKEAVEEVVQRNLRLVLGAQFTEKEGQRLISRAYNPRLDETENKKRVDRLIKSIESAMKEKQSQARYFNKNGTLKGYQFAPISIQSIERDAFGGNSNDPSAPASQATIDELEKKRQLRSKRAGL